MAQDCSAQTLLTFIITYHNEPVEMLSECIESIRQLNMRDDEREIIIVDDGSDRSPINEMEDQRTHVLYIYQNSLGVSAARNKGLAMATGRYIQFVDADDCLLTDAYDHCVSLLREGVDMVMFNYTTRPQATTSNSYRNTTYASGASLMHNKNIKGAAWYYIFRKEAANELRFTEGTHYAEDEEFTARLMLRIETIIQTDAKAYYYRQHPSSTTHDINRIEKRLDDTHSVICRLHQELRRLPQYEQTALQRRIAQLTMDYLYNIITLTQSSRKLSEAINTLQTEGLFPLPTQGYSTKYKWFRRIIGTSFGRMLLLRTLPHIHKQS